MLDRSDLGADSMISVEREMQRNVGRRMDSI